MSNKDPFEEQYGHHSSFRPREPGASGSLIVKGVALVFVLAFAVLGYDRWRSSQERGLALPPPQASLPAEAPEQPADAVQEAAPEAEESAALPAIAPPPAAEEQEPPPAEPEGPFVVGRFVMEKDLRSNSFVGVGMINGKKVTLLADTGASQVVVPEAMAGMLGLKKGDTVEFNTGGGKVPHYSTQIETLSLGEIELRDVPAAINPAMQQPVVLLGMSALGALEMQIEQGKLVLTYRQAVPSHNLAADEPFKRKGKDCARHGNKFDRETLDCLKGK